MDEAVLHSDSGELDPGHIEQVTSLFLFPVVHAGLTGVFFLDRVRQQFSDGIPFSKYRCNVIAVYFCLFLREPAGIVSRLYSQSKRPAGYPIHAGLSCEPEGLSPDGGLLYATGRKLSLTGEPWHLSCHGGKTPANQLSLKRPCAPMARSPAQGALPLRLRVRGDRDRRLCADRGRWCDLCRR